MSTKIDLQGPMFIRVMGEDGVLLERHIKRGETLYIDTEPEAQSNVITMVMGDQIDVREPRAES